jgi:anti-sigma factor RsiW
MSEEPDLPEDAFLLARFSKPRADLWETAQGRKHVDVTQGACMLCQRGLGTDEKLEKHVRGSQLHATNLAIAGEAIMAALTPPQKEAFDRTVREAS